MIDRSMEIPVGISIPIQKTSYDRRDELSLHVNSVFYEHMSERGAPGIEPPSVYDTHTTLMYMYMYTCTHLDVVLCRAYMIIC